MNRKICDGSERSRVPVASRKHSCWTIFLTQDIQIKVCCTITNKSTRQPTTLADAIHSLRCPLGHLPSGIVPSHSKSNNNDAHKTITITSNEDPKSPQLLKEHQQNKDTKMASNYTIHSEINPSNRSFLFLNSTLKWCTHIICYPLILIKNQK